MFYQRRNKKTVFKRLIEKGILFLLVIATCTISAFADFNSIDSLKSDDEKETNTKFFYRNSTVESPVKKANGDNAVSGESLPEGTETQNDSEGFGNKSVTPIALYNESLEEDEVYIEHYDENENIITTPKKKPAVTTTFNKPVITQPGAKPNASKPSEKTQQPLNTVSGAFTFVTYGWGHGVGLSQNGANFYAHYSGYNYQQILQHYYPGVNIVQTGESPDVPVAGVSKLEAVVRCTMNEIGTSFHPEAIKAQAVAIYTYIGYENGLNDLKMRDAVIPQWYWDLIASVYGQACYYGGKYALTMFGASCGGATANCKEIFTADLPYLRSVPSQYDSKYDPHYGTQKTITAQEVRTKIQDKYGIVLSDNPANWFKMTTGGGGYIATVTIDGQKTIKGQTFRTMLGLKSAKFEITYAQ
jgi:peptidoglycan hydrolase-like amidase